MTDMVIPVVDFEMLHAEIRRLRAALEVYADDYEGNELAREVLGLPPRERAEIERLNSYVAVLDDNVAALQEQVADRNAENERLNQALDMVAEEREAWKAAFHRSHEMRGEWLKACPLCEPREVITWEDADGVQRDVDRPKRA